MGPIDPQVRGRDGRLLPAQGLLTMVAGIQQEAEQRLKQGQQPQWAHVMLLRNIDPKELGNAVNQSRYSIALAADYLERYKFKSWTQRSDGAHVTTEHRRAKAVEIATRLAPFYDPTPHDYPTLVATHTREFANVVIARAESGQGDSTNLVVP